MACALGPHICKIGRSEKLVSQSPGDQNSLWWLLKSQQSQNGKDWSPIVSHELNVPVCPSNPAERCLVQQLSSCRAGPRWCGALDEKVNVSIHTHLIPMLSPNTTNAEK